MKIDEDRDKDVEEHDEKHEKEDKEDENKNIDDKQIWMKNSDFRMR